MIGVSNTSPLIVLSKMGYVDFLQKNFERIYIPISVEQEIFKKDDDVTKAVKVLIEQGFIEVKSTENVSLVQVLNVELGIGESQAIALSKEIKPDYVLLDDLKARQYARPFKINIIGTLGIIHTLLRDGIIKEEPNEIYRMLRSADFWISRKLFQSLFE